MTEAIKTTPEAKVEDNGKVKAEVPKPVYTITPACASILEKLRALDDEGKPHMARLGFVTPMANDAGEPFEHTYKFKALGLQLDAIISEEGKGYALAKRLKDAFDNAEQLVREALEDIHK